MAAIRISEFFYAYGRTLRLMGRMKLWLPLLIQAFLIFLAALAHYYVFSPITGPLVRFWAGLVGGNFSDTLFHYYSQFEVFPYFFGHAALLINVFIEAFMFATLIDMSSDIYHNKTASFGKSFRRAGGMYLKLFVVWLLFNAIFYCINRFFIDFVTDVIGYSIAAAPRREIAVKFIMHVLLVILAAVFVFVLPALMTSGRSFGGALKKGFGFALRHPFIAFGVVMIPYLINLPVAVLYGDLGGIITEKFYPEMIFYLVLIEIVITMFANFLQVGSAVKLYLDNSE